MAASSPKPTVSKIKPKTDFPTLQNTKIVRRPKYPIMATIGFQSIRAIIEYQIKLRVALRRTVSEIQPNPDLPTRQNTKIGKRPKSQEWPSSPIIKLRFYNALFPRYSRNSICGIIHQRTGILKISSRNIFQINVSGQTDRLPGKVMTDNWWKFEVERQGVLKLSSGNRGVPHGGGTPRKNTYITILFTMLCLSAYFLSYIENSLAGWNDSV